MTDPAAPGPVELIACVSCGSNERESHGSTRGERLLAQLRASAAELPPDFELTLSSVRCLWSCARSCAVHVRSRGRHGYVLCELEPTEGHARALLDYAALYAQTPDGAVPFKTWPQALRGHFLCRLPTAE